jgi:hypothetical protein
MPAFQQRHFEKIAFALQVAETKEQIITELCKLFRADNGRFCEARFRHACIAGNNIYSRSDWKKSA